MPWQLGTGCVFRGLGLSVQQQQWEQAQAFLVIQLNIWFTSLLVLCHSSLTLAVFFRAWGCLCVVAAATRAGSPSLPSGETQFTPQLVLCHSSLTLAVFFRAWGCLCVVAAMRASSPASSPSLIILFAPQQPDNLCVFQGLGLSLCSSSNESKQPCLVTQLNNTVCSTAAWQPVCVSGPGAVQQQQEPAACPPPQVPAPGYAAACQAPSPGIREVHLWPQLLVRQHGECQGVWGMSAGQSLPLLVSGLQLQTLFK